MSSAFALSAPGLNPLDVLKAGIPATAKLSPGQTKARAAAQDFEAVFLNSMFQQMFTGVEGDGPMGGKGPAGVWRSFLTDEYSKTFAKAGGIGIADHVYRALMVQQGAAS
jgi:peptidoglycan hydrolase FlgJ